ncbi:MAG: hypothetical protein F6K24_29985 [Okeania sp. SIO2D1]|nr:hypothetical protein [Okeania sp. SIO2D1]
MPVHECLWMSNRQRPHKKQEVNIGLLLYVTLCISFIEQLKGSHPLQTSRSWRARIFWPKHQDGETHRHLCDVLLHQIKNYDVGIPFSRTRAFCFAGATLREHRECNHLTFRRQRRQDPPPFCTKQFCTPESSLKSFTFSRVEGELHQLNPILAICFHGSLRCVLPLLLI